MKGLLKGLRYISQIFDGRIQGFTNYRTVCRTRSRRAAADIKRGEDEADTVVDVGDLSDGEVSKAEACHARGVERVVGLHRVLQNGDSDGVVHRRGVEAAAEAEAKGLRAYGAHGTTLPRLLMRGILVFISMSQESQLRITMVLYF
ncbi:hypothetical protein Zm00014a_004074 [Zea mays]|uniref:Uncharacterized protein n=1 Tax=Zea mays TaxID=4577 RepID=A0A317YEY9_MAIZE|nr:hypothetical protein Zm00014a_004074 [Zea mays]